MLTVYCVATFSWSWSLWLLALSSISKDNTLSVQSSVLLLIGNYGPMASAFLIAVCSSGKPGIRSMFLQLFRGNPTFEWTSVSLFGIIPILLAADIAYAALGGHLPQIDVNALNPLLPISFILSLFGPPIGEEFGWRGYALPELQRHHNALTSSIIVGVIWGTWHLPLLATYQSPDMVGIAALYLARIAMMSVIFTVVYNNTGGNLLMPILLHGSVNTWTTILAPSSSSAGPLFVLSTIAIAVVTISSLVVYDTNTLAHIRRKA